MNIVKKNIEAINAMKLVISIKIMFVNLLLISCLGCEDVVQIDTPSEEPRLIVEAIIKVDTSQDFVPLEIKVSLTSPFFGAIPAANLEQITMTNVNGGVGFVFVEQVPGSGIYIDDSVPKEVFTLNRDEWILQINWEGEQFLARTTFVPVVPINDIVQGTETLFNENDTEVIVTFRDDPNRDDYYLFDFDFAEFLVTEDQFFQGEEFSFSYFYEDGLDPGVTPKISIIGVDQQFYNYMDQLIDQSGDQGFGPFDTPAATIRGNLINVTNIDNINTFDNVDQTDNFALGYFAIVQTFSKTITIK